LISSLTILLTVNLFAVEGILLYGLAFIAGLFLCITLVSVLVNNKFISIRYQSEYFFLAVILEIAITLLLVDF